MIPFLKMDILGQCPIDKPFVSRGDGNDVCVDCNYPLVLEIEKAQEKIFQTCSNRESREFTYVDYKTTVSQLKQCPPESPLRTFMGDCISCNNLNLSVFLGGFNTLEGGGFYIHVNNKVACDKCPNLTYKNSICYYCPKDKPMINPTGCFDCETEQTDFDEEECKKCPNRDFRHGNCYKKCSSNEMMSYTNTSCYHFIHKCLDCNTPTINLEEKECQKCSNRIFRHDRCEFKESPVRNKPLIDYKAGIDCETREEFALFYDCNTDENVGTSEQCAQCPNRQYSAICGCEKIDRLNKNFCMIKDSMRDICICPVY